MLLPVRQHAVSQLSMHRHDSVAENAASVVAAVAAVAVQDETMKRKQDGFLDAANNRAHACVGWNHSSGSAEQCSHAVDLEDLLLLLLSLLLLLLLLLLFVRCCCCCCLRCYCWLASPRGSLLLLLLLLLLYVASK